jgi:hypothetical protein
MGHSAELIQSILSKVQKNYPVEEFNFTIEQAIPGTRMYPDILVRDKLGNNCCAVEIGYTRPEKLTAYRQKLKIPDVRWYDKDGNLHADVQEKTVTVNVQARPVGTFAVYVIYDMVECCDDEPCYRIALLECDLTEDDLRNPPQGREEEITDKAFELSDYLCMDVTTIAVTDYARVWFACYCDKCGAEWFPLMESSMDLQGIAGDLENYSARELADVYGARRFYGEWEGAAAWVADYLGMELDYQSGEFLSKQQEQEFRRTMSAVRMEAIRV